MTFRLRGTQLFIMGTIAITILFFTFCSGQLDRPAPATEVPQEIAAAFKTQFPDGFISELTEEIEEGLVIYEIEFTSQGKDMCAKYGADGEVLELEQSITVSELPEVIYSDIADNYARFSITQIDRISSGDSVYYEIDILELDKRLTIERTYSSSGELLAIETENDD